MDVQGAVGVDDDVVPGGHDFAVLLLRWIPGWADVVLRSAEDGECSHWMILTPLRIGAGQVPAQDAGAGFEGVIEERKVTGVETAGADGHERCERMTDHGRLKYFRPCFGEGGGDCTSAILL